MVMFGFGKPKSYLGVDLGAGGVKVVELKLEKKRPLLFTYGMTMGSHDIHRLLQKREAEVAASPAQVEAAKKSTLETFVIDKDRVESYAKVLKSVCEESKVTTKRAVASLPVSSVFHSIVTLPPVKHDEFDRILRAEIKKLLPYPIEEMVLDYQVLPSTVDTKAQRVLVNAVPRALVVFFTQVFKLAGLELDSLEPESIALSRALIGRDNAVTMLVDIGAERTNFFIVEETIPITHRTIEMGGDKINTILESAIGKQAPLTEQLKRDVFTNILERGDNPILSKQQFFALFNSVIDPILKEIAYGFEMYLRQSANLGKRPEKIVLTGGGGLFPYLAQEISDKFKMKCYVGDPWGRVVYPDSLKPIIRPLAPRLAVAIGLALRNML